MLPFKLQLERVESSATIPTWESIKNIKQVFHHHDFAAFLSFADTTLHSQHSHHHHTNEDDKCPVDENGVTSPTKPTTAASSKGLTTSTGVTAPVVPVVPLKRMAVLSGVISSFPALKLDRNVEIKPLVDYTTVLTEEIKSIYVYMLSSLIIDQNIDRCKSVVNILANTFSVDPHTHAELSRLAYDLTKHYLNELQDRSTRVTQDRGTMSPNQFSDRSKYNSWKDNQLARIKELQTQVQKLPMYHSKLEVEIVSATGLRVKDKATNSSDPYVCVHLTHNDDRCTNSKAKHSHATSVKKATLTPVWNETFKLESNSPNDHCLIASVFDHDIITKNDFMGTALLELSGADLDGDGIIDDPNFDAIPLGYHTMEVMLQGREKRNGFFKRLIGKSSPAPQQSNSDDHKRGSLKLSYYYIQRQFIKSDNIESVNVRKLLDLDHKHVMHHLIHYLFNTKLVDFKLDSEITKLLIEYEKRVGLSSFVRLSTMLEIVLSKFLISLDILTLILDILTQLTNDIFVTRSVTLNTEENIKLVHLVKQVKQQFKSLISKYGLSFPVIIDEATGQIKGLGENGTLLSISVTILKSVCNLLFHINIGHNLASKPDNQVFNNKIDKYLKSFTDYFFGLIKEKSMIKIEDSKDFDNVVGLLDIYDSIELQITNDIDIYAQFFGGLDLGTKSARMYYQLLKTETEYILEKEDGVCMETFTLLKKIQKLENDVLSSYQEDIKDIKMDLDKLFLPFVNKWIDEAKTQFEAWLKRSISKEKWEAIDKKNKVFHSNSVLDLFSIFEIGKNHLSSLQLENVVKGEVLIKFIKVVGLVYNEYLDAVMSAIMTDLNEMFSQVVDHGSFTQLLSCILKCKNKDKDDQQPPPDNSIKLPLCVKLNCIEFSRQLLDDLSNEFETRFSDSAEQIRDTFLQSFSLSRKKYEYVVDLCISKIGQWIEMSFNTMVSKLQKQHQIQKKANDKDLEEIINYDDSLVQSAMEPLITYLTHELSTLSSNLYQTTFSRFIKGVWMILWWQFERKLFPTASTQKESDQILNIVSSLMLVLYEPMESFFHADGDGMSLEQLRNTQIEQLFNAVAVYYTPSSSLYEIHKKLILDEKIDSSGLTKVSAAGADLPFTNTTQIKEIHIISALSSRKSDKEAIKFVQYHKAEYKNRIINEKFNIPNKDSKLIYKSKCLSSLGIPTTIYIMNKFVCWTQMFSYTETNMSYPWTIISQIFKQPSNNHDTIHIVVEEKNFDLFGFPSSKLSKVFKTLLSTGNMFNPKIKLEPESPPTTTDNTNASQQTQQQINQQQQQQLHAVALFKLESTEKVLDSFSCLKRGILGKIILTESHFCYQNLITHSTQKYPWSDILDIKKEDSLFSTGLRVHFNSTGKRKLFNGLHNQRDKLYDSMIPYIKTK